MATSRAILIRDAIIAALNTDAPTDMPAARKRRAFPGEAIYAPFIAVFLHQEPARYPGNSRSPIMERERTVIVQIGVLSEDAYDIDDLAEVIRSWVVEVLGDNNLGGLVLSLEDRGIVEPPLVWKADAVYALVHVGFAAKFQTKRDDLGAEA